MPPPPVFLSRTVDRSVVAANQRTGRWVRVRRGAYVEEAHLPVPPAERARIVALGTQLRGDHVVSHESAAVLWGLPVLRTPVRTHIVQRASSRAGCSPDVVRHVHPLPPEHATELFDRRVTTLERTVVDCATACTPAAGLVVADAALHRGADRDECLRILASLGRRAGIVRARAVLDLADDGAESPGETLVRLAVLRAGLPRPVTQVPVATDLGTFWGDLGWPAWRVLVEYDGAAKYDAGREALLAEKRREDALRAAGWWLVRASARDLRDTTVLLRRVGDRLPRRGAPLTARPALA